MAAKPIEQKAAPVATPAKAEEITFAKALEELQKAENIKHPAEKKAAVEKWRGIVNRLQQGLPQIDITADALAPTKRTEDEIRMIRLEDLARHNRDVEWLLNSWKSKSK